MHKPCLILLGGCSRVEIDCCQAALSTPTPNVWLDGDDLCI
jgi:hypothetical protein